ncbi:hypothetical protein [Intestinibacillus sp. Marseille-P6563]|uniref:hypothetical protein n=1 Tax=Intestinibacillus sp. Marseille-P6563 TaxID=2364792 RepID=UPI000F050D9E|nr:hypothetical protein [Intestinibacillus sp. Marseille-P6563]
MNTNYTIPAFTEPITSLPDTPTCEAAELKRRFQAPADEVREAHNALAEAHEKLDEKVEGIVTETFTGAIHENMFDEELAEKLNGKADEESNQEAHMALDTRLKTAETKLTVQSGQISQKSEVYFGTYTGTADPHTGIGNQVITLGFTPKAILVLRHGVDIQEDTWSYGGMALTGHPAMRGQDPALEIVTNGFKAYSGNNSTSSTRIRLNDDSDQYYYFAFK